MRGKCFRQRESLCEAGAGQGHLGNESLTEANVAAVEGTR